MSGECDDGRDSVYINILRLISFRQLPRLFKRMLRAY